MKSKTLIKSKHKKVMASIAEEDFEQAKTLCEACCRMDKGNSQFWFLLGAINGQLELFEEAAQAAQKAISIDPNFIEAHYNLAQACMHMGNITAAEQSYRQLLRLNPDHIDALHNLGYVREQHSDYKEAIDCYNKVIINEPSHVDANNNVGNLLIDIGNVEEGIKFLKQAVRYKPDFVKAHTNLGYALYNIGKLDEAEACFNKIDELEPDSLQAILGRAAIYEKRGDIDKAYQLIQPHLDTCTPDNRLAQLFARIASRINQIDKAINLAEDLISRSDSSDKDRQPLHLALGKLYNEKNEHEKAFPHFEKANQLRPVYQDGCDYNQQIDDIIKLFTQHFLNNNAGSENTSRKPIFIIGMPRSGTTLVEQILASHPEVYGGGELKNIQYIIDSLPNITQNKQAYPGCIESATQPILNKVAQQYIDSIQKLNTEAKHITDKMPHNFLHLGLIQLLFPQARVIHCMRNPLDTCLSIYFHDFNASHGYATDLTQLGEHYLKYQEIMLHWKSVLSISIMEVKYEQMVAEQENMSRKIIEFCGLEWDEACLKFYESKRVVNTLSYNQVRQPIYKNAVNRWKPYEKHLVPLIDALGIAP